MRVAFIALFMKSHNLCLLPFRWKDALLFNQEHGQFTGAFLYNRGANAVQPSWLGRTNGLQYNTPYPTCTPPITLPILHHQPSHLPLRRGLDFRRYGTGLVMSKHLMQEAVENADLAAIFRLVELTQHCFVSICRYLLSLTPVEINHQ